MEIIADNTIMVFDANHDDIVNSDSESVATAGFQLGSQDGHAVSSYVELLKKVASLSYYNPRFQLLFRGQTADHKMGTHIEVSDLYPSILRQFVPNMKERRNALEREFELLIKAEQLLVEHIIRKDLEPIHK